MARGTVFRGWMISPALAAIAEKPKKVMNPSAAIVDAAGDCSLLIAGASERGLLVRLVRGSPVRRIVDEVDRSVVLAERARDRSLLDRLLGR